MDEQKPPTGDDVGGDKIDVGNVENAKGIAVGSDINQVTNEGSRTAIQIYNQPSASQRKRRAAKRTSSGMSATVEEKIRDKLNEHDVKLAKLEIADDTVRQNMSDYVRDLRQDIVDIKAELKPLRNQGILAQPAATDKEATEKVKEQNKLVLRLLTIIAISFGAGVLLFVGFVIWLTLSRV